MEGKEVVDIIARYKPGYRVYEPNKDDLNSRDDKLLVLIESPTGYQKIVVVSKSKKKLVGVN